ncbi:MAG: glycosyltransferase [Lewinellaceae bacterium]|nr:glycosyltransferase [Saprospiraceae bacterium]MCB9339361.1 glycosyltransferase [Lewinellaceae bacterium]
MSGQVAQVEQKVKHNKHQGKVRLPRVAIISSERYPHHDTNTQQIIKNANAMSAAGLQVELVVPVQYKGFFKQNYDLSNAIYAYYNVPPGLKIKALRTFPASNLRWEKFFHSIAGTLYAVFSKKIDLAYTRNKFTALLCLFFGKKFIFETYRRHGDEYPKTMRWLAKRARGNTFVGMVLHSKVAADSMQKAGFPKEKLLVLHNGYDNADMLPVLTKQAARDKLGLAAGTQYVVYTGNMQKNKCIESLVDMAGRLPNTVFLLVGGRPEDVDRLKQYAGMNRVSNVLFTGRLPISVVSEYLYAADVLIIPPVSAPLEKYGRTVLPFKLFPYLAAGRPILAPDQPDMRELLSHHENALLVEPDNLAQDAQALAMLLADEPLQEKLSENALDTSKGLTWEERAAKFIVWLEAKWGGK